MNVRLLALVAILPIVGCVMPLGPRAPHALAPLATAGEVPGVIGIRSAADVRRRRVALTRLIWSGRGFPAHRMPDAVHGDVVDSVFVGMPNLARIDLLAVAVDSGITSRVYHFLPRGAAEGLVIYHDGHGGGFARGREMIEALVHEGFAVLAVAMPLEGMNSRPLLHVAGVGPLRLAHDDHLKLLGTPSSNPLHFFVEPVAAALNHALVERKYPQVAMVGLSGGAWTTVLYAALDPRVELSFPVAGTIPTLLRERADWGDYEQTVPEVLRIAGELDQYVRGASGPGRRQLQIFNEHDPCCFAGTRSRTYEPAVRAAVQEFGPGSFDVHLDSSHAEHKISSAAQALILEALKHRSERRRGGGT